MEHCNIEIVHTRDSFTQAFVLYFNNGVQIGTMKIEKRKILALNTPKRPLGQTLYTDLSHLPRDVAPLVMLKYDDIFHTFNPNSFFVFVVNDEKRYIFYKNGDGTYTTYNHATLQDGVYKSDAELIIQGDTPFLKVGSESVRLDAREIKEIKDRVGYNGTTYTFDLGQSYADYGNPTHLKYKADNGSPLSIALEDASPFSDLNVTAGGKKCIPTAKRRRKHSVRTRRI